MRRFDKRLAAVADTNLSAASCKCCILSLPQLNSIFPTKSISIRAYPCCPTLICLTITVNTALKIVKPPIKVLNVGTSFNSKKAKTMPYTGSKPAVTLANWALISLRLPIKSN